MTFALRLRIFLPFALGYFISYLYRTINAVLAPNLAADIGVNPADLGLLTGAYFITFAAAQLPLGVLLDRFGPRKVEGVLLGVAALGAVVFAQSESLAGLVIGRGLIGLGVSACLMAAFKAFTLWFPKEKLPLVNSFQMASGGLGALAATAPVEAALHIADWRQIFLALGGLTLLAGVLVYRIVPPRPTKGAAVSFGDSVRGIGRVLGSRTFWRIAPWATLSQASFLSIHGLWAGPWLRDVAGFDREAVAGTLLLLAAAILAGYLGMGALAERLGRRGIPPMSVAAGGMIVFMANLLLIAREVWPWPVAAWLVYGFFGTSGILPYAVLSQRFPVALSGRVNTALNLLVFVSAFAAQWGIGAIIELWIPPGPDRYAPDGYAAAFALLVGLQALAAIWFFLTANWEAKQPLGDQSLG